MLCFNILFSLAYRMLQQIITLMLQDTILKQTFSSDVFCLTLKSRITRPLFYISGVCLFHSTVEPNSFPPWVLRWVSGVRGMAESQRKATWIIPVKHYLVWRQFVLPEMYCYSYVHQSIFTSERILSKMMAKQEGSMQDRQTYNSIKCSEDVYIKENYSNNECSIAHNR